MINAIICIIKANWNYLKNMYISDEKNLENSWTFRKKSGKLGIKSVVWEDAQKSGEPDKPGKLAPLPSTVLGGEAFVNFTAFPLKRETCLLRKDVTTTRLKVVYKQSFNFDLGRLDLFMRSKIPYHHLGRDQRLPWYRLPLSFFLQFKTIVFWLKTICPVHTQTTRL